MNCGLIIPTLNAGSQFKKLLEQLAAQTLPTKKIIVDSESTHGEACQKFRTGSLDDTAEEFQSRRDATICFRKDFAARRDNFFNARCFTLRQ